MNEYVMLLSLDRIKDPNAVRSVSMFLITRANDSQ